MPKYSDYLMDPQAWNPDCNKYLVKLNETARSLNVEAEVSAAYDTFYKAKKEAGDALLRKLNKIFGDKWDEIIST